MSRQESSSVRWLLVTSFCVFFAVAGIAEGAEPSSDKPVALDAHDAQLKWGPCPPLFPKGCEIAVLRGDPSEPNADVFLKVPANYTIPPHWHTSAERMVLVSGGAACRIRRSQLVGPKAWHVRVRTCQGAAQGFLQSFCSLCAIHRIRVAC